MRRRSRFHFALLLGVIVIVATLARLEDVSEPVAAKKPTVSVAKGPRELPRLLRWNCASSCVEGVNSGFYFELRIERSRATYAAWLSTGNESDWYDILGSPERCENHHHDRPIGVYAESGEMSLVEAEALSRDLLETSRRAEVARLGVLKQRCPDDPFYFVECDGLSHISPGQFHNLTYFTEHGSETFNPKDLKEADAIAHNSIIAECRDRLVQRWRSKEAPDLLPHETSLTHPYTTSGIEYF